MRTPWPAEALGFQESVAGSLDRIGGIDLSRACERNPSVRIDRLRPALDALLVFDLDPSVHALDAAVASLCARAAGDRLCAWPLIQQLAVPAPWRDQVDALYLVDGEPLRLEHLDLVPRAAALDVRTMGLRGIIPTGRLAPLPLDPFGVPCRLGAQVEVDGQADVLASVVVLTAYWVLGALDRVVRQVAAYAADRHQFGRPIASFGAIQWRLSELAVAHAGFVELAGFTLARTARRRATRADALALRLGMLEAADCVLAHGHQILGAIGLCEEHDVTLVDRHLQPVLRRAGGATSTTRLLAAAIAQVGFDAIRPIVPVELGRDDDANPVVAEAS